MSDRLYKRGDVWWCWYYDALKKRVRTSTRCTDRRAAERVLGDLERKAHDPKYKAAHETTVRTALEQALKAIAARGRAQATLEMYATKMGHVLRLLGEHTPLAQVDAAAIDHFTETRLEEGASRSTIGKELTAVRQMLKIAKRRGQYPFDLAEVLPEQWSADYQPRKRCLPNGIALQTLVDELLPDRGAHVCFLVATAARDSEAAAARRIDIDMPRGVVRIRGAKTDASDDAIAIVSWMEPLLEHVLRTVGDKPGPLFRPWGNCRGDLLDACRRGAIALRDRAAQLRAFGHEEEAGRTSRAAAALEAGISPNDLRRTHAQWLRAAGTELAMVARQLRHKSPKMVFQVYGQMDASTVRSVLAAALDGEQRDAGVTDAGAPRGRNGQDGRLARRDLVPRDGIEPPTRGFSILASRRSHDGRTRPAAAPPPPVPLVVPALRDAGVSAPVARPGLAATRPRLALVKGGRGA